MQWNFEMHKRIFALKRKKSNEAPPSSIKLHRAVLQGI